MAGIPDVVLTGLPERTAATGIALDEVVDAALFQTFKSFPSQSARDANVVSVAIEKAVRAAVAGIIWNKRPAVHVLVIEV